jgi:hypothetical protein
VEVGVEALAADGVVELGIPSHLQKLPLDRMARKSTASISKIF